MITAVALASLVIAPNLGARTGMGDPVEVFRERPVSADDDLDVVFHGSARLRTAFFHDADLGLVSPTTTEPAFVRGSVFGSDLRARLSPSLFIGDSLRLYADIDAAQIALGPTASGVPTSRDPHLQLSFIDVRALALDWVLPIGVLSIGRMPSHFGLGIGTNDGNALDDDGGDRADRIAFVAPFFGHLVAAAFDTSVFSRAERAANGAVSQVGAQLGPRTRALTVGDQAISVGVMRWHAPWEVELYRNAARPLFDYGGGFAAEWRPAPWDALARSANENAPAPASFDGNARLLVIDAWLRFVWGAFSIEGEAWAGDLFIENPSPWPGVVVREPLRGNPYAGVVVAELRAIPQWLTTSLEGGVASGDPAPGFATNEPTAFARAVPGDVFGPQIDVHAKDTRIDAARIHPLHRVDLILWRTILGGVSEAAYVRAGVESTPHELVTVDAHLIYSHALEGAQTPGGRAPLGAELDVGCEVRAPFQIFDGTLSGRIDAGVMQPLGGMATRGSTGASPAEVVIARVGYAL
jgi:uncharacterized protein (TIGR04551 family)